MSALLWTLLGIVLVLLIIWLILRWRRRAAETRTVPAGVEPSAAVAEPVTAVAAPIVAVAEPVVAVAEPVVAVAVAEPVVAAAEPGTVPDPQVLDLKAAALVLGRAVKADDLTVLEGIGPKISGLLHAAGLRTWHDLAQTPVPTLAGILVAAGPRFGMHDPGTWPRQAGLLASGQWEQFKRWTSELDRGRERA